MKPACYCADCIKSSRNKRNDLLRRPGKPRAVGVDGTLQRQIGDLRGRIETEAVGQRTFGGRLSV